MDNEAFNNFTNQDFSGLSKFLDSLDPYEFALIGAVAGFLIAPTLTITEQNAVGNLLEQVGQILLTIASQAQNIQGVNNNTNSQSNTQNNNVKNELNDLKKEIERLKNLINKT